MNLRKNNETINILDLDMKMKSFEYYDMNYSPLFLYMQRSKTGGFEVVDILKEKVVSNPLFKITDSQKRCRYCGKTVPEVSFNKKEHIFPESIGNKLFISKGCECDDCNKFFGENYENDLNAFLFPCIVLNGIVGKNGHKKYKSFDTTSTVDFSNDILTIKEQIGKAKIRFDEANKQIFYDFDIQPYSLAKVYKILLKMALAILPEDSVKDYQIMNNNIMNDCLLGYEYLIYNFYPGFNRFDLATIGWIRKSDDSTLPTYQFAIMNGNFLLQIPLYNDRDIAANNGKTFTINCLSTPTPFDCSIMGDVKSQVLQVKDTSITPAHTITMTLKYDEKIANDE